MLEARGLTKYYSAITGVRDVNFQAQPGSVLGLLGPNGSGKSTTVGMLTGLLEPSGGLVLLNGVDMRADLLQYKQQLGYVPEEAQLYTWMSGAEYLTFCARLRGLSDARSARRIDALLGIFGLDLDRDAPMSAYSKGMRQKILLSAALLHNPSIVVLDEPCSGLDVGATLVIRSLIKRLSASGRIVIYSSHELEMVEKVCTDVLILREGRVAAHATTAVLREQVNAASLEDAFRALVFTTDVDAVAGDIIAAITH
ncbi:MAG TPA: ABC transporter ATP-binding protein [Vicinamibacterales bacterium]|nr:ABC transporter ATP-binding protein [Vicinamibacterales bacterium]